MDGGSTDTTISIIKNFSDTVDHWISEEDKGIYSAFNKGISIARGEWIMFLGSDDYIAERNTISKFVEAIIEDKSLDLITSLIRYSRKGNHREIKGTKWDWEKLKKWMCVVHPGALHNKDLFLEHGMYNETYKIASDYEFFLRLGPKINSKHLEKITVIMSEDGLSKKEYIKALQETKDIQSKHPDIGNLYALYNYYIAFIKSTIKQNLLFN